MQPSNNKPPYATTTTTTTTTTTPTTPPSNTTYFTAEATNQTNQTPSDKLLSEQKKRIESNSKYNMLGCKHTSVFTEGLFTAILPKSGGAFPGYIAEKKHDETAQLTQNPKKRWIVKPGVPHDNVNPQEVTNIVSFTNRQAKIGAIQECMASVLYDYLGDGLYIVPKTKVAELTWINDFTSSDPRVNILKNDIIAPINRNRAEGDKLTKGVHILSKMVQNYRDIEKAKVIYNGKEVPFMDYVKANRTAPEKIIVDNQEIPLVGFMEILAIGKLLHDVDVLGGGNNIGFIVEDTINGKVAKAVKIDPGLAFYIFHGEGSACINADIVNMFLKSLHFSDSNNIAVSEYKDKLPNYLDPMLTNIGSYYRKFYLQDLRDIQTNSYCNYIKWDNLSKKQQIEFLRTLHMGAQHLKNKELIKHLLWRDGSMELSLGKSVKSVDIDEMLNILDDNCNKLIEVYASICTEHGLEMKVSVEDGTIWTYFGGIKEGKRDGFGIIHWVDGNKYIGEWLDGKQHGHGTETLADGNKYEGEWQNGNKHGHGTFTWENGNKYVGEFKDGKKHGQGTETGALLGYKYVGEFKDGNRHGHGTYTFATWAYGYTYISAFTGKPQHSGILTRTDGNKYVGEFKDGNWHGQGTLTLADGDTYVGEFKDGKKHGQGTKTWADGDKYEGNFKDDNKHGHGTLTWENGKKYGYIYVGEWIDDNKHGYGTLTFADGRIYVGEFKDDNKHGYGTLTFADGRIYVGEFKDGNRHGLGTDTWADGATYVGEFKNGNMHGQGTFTSADGKYVGGYKAGKMHGHGTYTLADGGKYVGEYKDDKRWQGVLTFSNGSTKKWENGKENCSVM